MPNNIKKSYLLKVSPRVEKTEISKKVEILQVVLVLRLAS